MRLSLTLIPVDGAYDRMAQPCFGDVLTVLNRTLTDMGHAVTICTHLWPEGERAVILNYCVCIAKGAAEDAKVPPPGSVIYNQEAYDSAWAPAWPLVARAVHEHGATLWEMRAQNMSRWRDDYRIDAVHVPFGYVPELERVRHDEVKPIDVLLYGSLSPRREAVLRTMAHWGVRSHFHPMSSGLERERLMGQAKVILSARFASGYQVENIRLIHALANECFVICEEGPGLEAFHGGLVSSDYDSLTYVCADWLSRPEERRRAVARNGRTLAKATRSAVRTALEAADL